MNKPYIPQTKRADQKAVTRQRVVDSAKTVFGTLGYERATMRDIANTAGLSTGAIFSQWPDKAALYAEIYGHPPISPEQGRHLIRVLEMARKCIADKCEGWGVEPVLDTIDQAMNRATAAAD